MSTGYQELAFRKNELYRNNYRRMIKWVVRMLFLTVILAATLSWMTIRRPQPMYYAAVTNGQVLQMHSLSEPVITDKFIVSWSALTARRVFNLSFVNYQDNLNVVKDRFTPGGWEKMQDALNSSGLIQNMVNNKLIVSSVVSGSPVILARMVVNGRFTWRVQMQMLVKYTSASEQSQENLVVTMNIQRIPTLDSAQGIQINDFQAAPAQ